MLKNMRFRINTDPRGSISSGEMTSEGVPKSLEYFDVSDFSELTKMYGEKPTQLILYFPTDNPTDFCDLNMDLYAKGKGKEKGTLVRRCDGETCVHRMTETVGGKTYQAGEETPCICIDLPEKDPKLCRGRGWCNAWVADPETNTVENHLCYRFTSGRSSIENILGELTKIATLNHGVLRGIPFRLTVEMVASTQDVKIKFPVWKLFAVPMMSEIRKLTNQRTTLQLESGRPIEEAKTVEHTPPDPPKKPVDFLVDSLNGIEHTKEGLDKWASDNVDKVKALPEKDKENLRNLFRKIRDSLPAASEKLFD